jgi:hypothetical protein
MRDDQLSGERSPPSISRLAAELISSLSWLAAAQLRSEVVLLIP